MRGVEDSGRVGILAFMLIVTFGDKSLGGCTTNVSVFPIATTTDSPSKPSSPSGNVLFGKDMAKSNDGTSTLKLSPSSLCRGNGLIVVAFARISTL